MQRAGNVGISDNNFSMYRSDKAARPQITFNAYVFCGKLDNKYAFISLSGSFVSLLKSSSNSHFCLLSLEFPFCPSGVKVFEWNQFE